VRQRSGCGDGASVGVDVGDLGRRTRGGRGGKEE
jgi:hypothetical protein